MSYGSFDDPYTEQLSIQLELILSELSDLGVQLVQYDAPDCTWYELHGDNERRYLNVKGYEVE